MLTETVELTMYDSPMKVWSAFLAGEADYAKGWLGSDMAVRTGLVALKAAHWLEGVRGKAIEKLPEDEQAEWQRFWVEVEELHDLLR